VCGYFPVESIQIHAPHIAPDAGFFLRSAVALAEELSSGDPLAVDGALTHLATGTRTQGGWWN